LSHLDGFSLAGCTRRSVLAVAALCLSMAMFAGACDSSSKSSPSPTPAGTSEQPTATAASGSPTPVAPVATVVDPASTPLQPDPDSGEAYTLQYPVGWSATNIPAPGGFGRRYARTLNGAMEAQITIRCAAGGTVDALMLTDQSLVTGIHGNWAVNGIVDMTVAGMTGKRVEYTLAFGGRQQEARVLYLQGKICGWVILEQAYGTGQLARYAPLFNAIVATFNPTTAGG